MKQPQPHTMALVKLTNITGVEEGRHRKEHALIPLIYSLPTGKTREWIHKMSEVQITLTLGR